VGRSSGGAASSRAGTAARTAGAARPADRQCRRPAQRPRDRSARGVRRARVRDAPRRRVRRRGQESPQTAILKRLRTLASEMWERFRTASGARSEWRRRCLRALDTIASDDPPQSRAGRAIVAYIAGCGAAHRGTARRRGAARTRGLAGAELGCIAPKMQYSTSARRARRRVTALWDEPNKVVCRLEGPWAQQRARAAMAERALRGRAEPADAATSRACSTAAYFSSSPTGRRATRCARTTPAPEHGGATASGRRAAGGARRRSLARTWRRRRGRAEARSATDPGRVG